MKRGSSGQIKFRIVLDSVMMMVGMVSVSLAEVTHESEVVGVHEVAEASKSSRPASDRNTEPKLRIKPHTLFLISRVSECGKLSHLKEGTHTQWFQRPSGLHRNVLIGSLSGMKGFGIHLSSDHCYKPEAHLQVLPRHISSQKCDMRLTRHLLPAQVHPMLFHAPLRLKDKQPWILESVKAQNTSASPNTVTAMFNPSPPFVTNSRRPHPELWFSTLPTDMTANPL
ncbi:unnamed protein product [Leuciscus chuanchicus]